MGVQRLKAMSKTFGNIDHFQVLLGKFYGDVVQKGSGTLTNIYDHVKYPSSYAADELYLCMWRPLIVEASDGSLPAGMGMVELHKIPVVADFFKFAPAEGARKEASLIPEGLKFYDIGALQFGFLKDHTRRLRLLFISFLVSNSLITLRRISPDW